MEQRPGAPLTVAIDGPAGVGKSTLARGLALAFGLPYVNTGLMYRAVALGSILQGADPHDGPAVAAIAARMRFTMRHDQPGEPPELMVDGRRPGPEVRSPEVEAVVSTVAAHPGVRAILRQRQRDLAAMGGVVEGRDIGSVVLPEADVKLFLQAAPEVRAERREQEVGGGEATSRSVARRDALDARTNPFVPAGDAVVLETTALDRDQVFAAAARLVQAGLERRGDVS